MAPVTASMRLYTCGNGTFGNDVEQTDTPGALGMTTSAELNALTELHNSHLVAVFLAKESNCA